MQVLFLSPSYLNINLGFLLKCYFVVVVARCWIQVFGSKRKAIKTIAPYLIMVFFPAVSQPPTQSPDCVGMHILK